MTRGAPHSEGDAFQWECWRCGYCRGEPRDGGEIRPYQYGSMNTAWMRR